MLNFREIFVKMLGMCAPNFTISFSAVEFKVEDDNHRADIFQL